MIIENNDIKLIFNDKEYEFEHLVFSGGEHHVRLSDVFIENCAGGELVITANIRNVQGVMIMMLLNSAVMYSCPSVHRVLQIPYLPYGRQDRVCSKGDAFSLEVFAQIVNSCNFDKVRTLMPHSSVSSELVCDLETMDEWFYDSVVEELLGVDNIVVVAPDKGATSRMYDLYDRLDSVVGYSWCNKTRNKDTGKIEGMTLCDPHKVVEGSNCVIVDDICDYGRTFIECAKLLIKGGASKVTLVAAHGILTGGLKVFEDLIDIVITTDTICCGMNDSDIIDLKVINV